MYHIPPLIPDVEGAAGATYKPLERKTIYTSDIDITRKDVGFSNVNVFTSTGYSGNFNALFFYTGRSGSTATSVQNFVVDSVTIASDAFQVFIGNVFCGAWVASVAAGTSSVTVSVEFPTSNGARVGFLSTFVINGPTYEIKGVYTSVAEDDTTIDCEVSTNIPASTEAAVVWTSHLAVSAGASIVLNPVAEQDYSPYVAGAGVTATGRVSASGTARNGYNVSVYGDPGGTLAGVTDQAMGAVVVSVAGA